MSGSLIVKSVLKDNGEVVGIRVYAVESGATFDVPRSLFYLVDGKLQNGKILKGGIFESEDGEIVIRESSVKLRKTGKYTLMHKDTPVLCIDYKSATIRLLNARYLPFPLRGFGELTFALVSDWVSNRVLHLDRDGVYAVLAARGTPANVDGILRDSYGLSVFDQYWFRPEAVHITWDGLKKSLDDNECLLRDVLFGEKDETGWIRNGVTSFYTLPGNQRQIVFDGQLYKLASDAVVDYVSWYIGGALGLPVQRCILEDGIVRMDLVADGMFSLVRASELKRFLDTSDDIYDIVRALGWSDLVSQLQRFYIFNYIIGNMLVRDDEFGFLYDSTTFCIQRLAPFYGVSAAFTTGLQEQISQGVNDSFGLVRKRAREFIGLHKDIAQKLGELDLEPISVYLDDVQMTELRERISELICCAELES